MKKYFFLIFCLLLTAWTGNAKEEETVTKQDPPTMREAYEYFVLEEKNPAFILNNEANFLTIKGRYEEAVEKYREALAVIPDNTVILNNLSWTLMMTGKYQDALDALKKSHALDSKNPSTNFYLGVAYWMLGDPENSRGYLRTAIDLDPNHPYSHYYLSMIYLKDGDIKEALAEAELCALILGNVWNPNVALYLGNLYGRAEMFQKALLQYQKLVDDKEYAFEAQYGLGITYGSFGDFDKAETHLLMALDLNDDDPMVYYALGKLYSQRDDELKKAKKYAGKALDYEPDNDRFLYLMGWISYRMDNIEEALGYMKQAMAAQPENATYRYQVRVLEEELKRKGDR